MSKPITRELFYLGGDFYWKSGTTMSSIYEVGTYSRWDWGHVKHLLSGGNSVTIRPANDAELLWAYKRLHEIEKNREEANAKR